jgi:hypothetical protein
MSGYGHPWRQWRRADPLVIELTTSYSNWMSSHQKPLKSGFSWVR